MTALHGVPPPRSRQEAKALGLKVYQSRRYCRFGHDGLRTVSRGQCVHCAETARVERARVRSKAAAALKAQIKAQVLRELAREQERQAKAEAKRQARELEAAEKQRAREVAELAALEVLQEAELAAALAERKRAARAHHRAITEAATAARHEVARIESLARFHASAALRSRPGVPTSNTAGTSEDDDTPPWD